MADSRRSDDSSRDKREFRDEGNDKCRRESFTVAGTAGSFQSAECSVVKKEVQDDGNDKCRRESSSVPGATDSFQSAECSTVKKEVQDEGNDKYGRKSFTAAGTADSFHSAECSVVKKEVQDESKYTSTLASLSSLSVGGDSGDEDKANEDDHKTTPPRISGRTANTPTSADKEEMFVLYEVSSQPVTKWYFIRVQERRFAVTFQRIQNAFEVVKQVYRLNYVPNSVSFADVWRGEVVRKYGKIISGNTVTRKPDQNVSTKDLIDIAEDCIVWEYPKQFRGK